LFRTQPKLIIGFNTFLPNGYSLEPTNNPSDPVRVTAPKGVIYNPSSSSSIAKTADIPVAQSYAYTAPAPEPVVKPVPPPVQPTPAPSKSTSNRTPEEFNHAINYVNKIKNRFASQPEVYRLFLEILQTYQKDDKPIRDVSRKLNF
jgi:paired amphipathic helix protein Sin3a